MPKPDMTPVENMLRAEAVYEQNIRGSVETEENVGKLCIIDPESGDFEIAEDKGAEPIHASRRLLARRPNSRLYAKKIGYNAAVIIGGVLERVSR